VAYQATFLITAFKHFTSTGHR